MNTGRTQDRFGTISMLQSIMYRRYAERSTGGERDTWKAGTDGSGSIPILLCVQIVLYVWDSRLSIPEQRELNGYTVFYSKRQEKLGHLNKFNPVTDLQ